ncbi:MAG TPA: glycosyltransferase [Rhizomicrobium sp.]
MLIQADTEKSGTSKRKLVVFAPYPPAKNGIADYVAELMPHHAAEFDVTLVIADDAPIPDDSGPRVLLASEFRKHRGYFASAPKLYHIGNNADHCYMLNFLDNDPGTVVLHDFNLCYLHEMATLRWGDRPGHFAAMESEYGALGTDLLAGQFRNEFRESFAGYELPLNGDVLERATAIITHSRHAQYKVAARVPHKPVWYVPHHFSPLAAEYIGFPKQVARSQLGLPQNDIIVTAVGFVTRAKQIALTLAALSSLRGKVGPFRFVLAGERRPLEYDVDADIAASGLGGLVTCTDYLDEEHFFKHLAAADIVVNLRYPSGGEMSGTLVRALGLGVPTIVLDHGPMGEFPHGVVKKIAWDDDPKAALTEALREMMTDAAAREELGARAAEFVRSQHAVGKVSAQYHRILLESASDAVTGPSPLKFHFPHPVTIARKLHYPGEGASDLARKSGGRMWWAVSGAPLGVDADHEALVVSVEGDGTAEMLSRLFDWRPQAITAMTVEEFLGARVHGHDDLPLRAGRFAFALILVSAQMEEPTAALLLRRLNVSLRLGGSVCLETWASRADEISTALLGRIQLRQRLRDAGFGSLRQSSPQDGLITELAGGQSNAGDARQFACVAARKISNYAVWRFADTPEGVPQRWGGRTVCEPRL